MTEADRNRGLIHINTLIIKLGATGDVVRTTPLLSHLGGQITWLTAAKNNVLLKGLTDNLRCFSWEERVSVLDSHYDLAIDLEDTLEVAQFLKTVRCGEIFGAYLNSDGSLRYTENSRRWFDLSLITSYGRQGADGLKLLDAVLTLGAVERLLFRDVSRGATLKPSTPSYRYRRP